MLNYDKEIDYELLKEKLNAKKLKINYEDWVNSINYNLENLNIERSIILIKKWIKNKPEYLEKIINLAFQKYINLIKNYKDKIIIKGWFFNLKWIDKIKKNSNKIYMLKFWNYFLILFQYFSLNDRINGKINLNNLDLNYKKINFKKYKTSISIFYKTIYNLAYSYDNTNDKLQLMYAKNAFILYNKLENTQLINNEELIGLFINLINHKINILNKKKQKKLNKSLELDLKKLNNWNKVHNNKFQLETNILNNSFNLLKLKNRGKRVEKSFKIKNNPMKNNFINKYKKFKNLNWLNKNILLKKKIIKKKSYLDKIIFIQKLMKGFWIRNYIKFKNKKKNQLNLLKIKIYQFNYIMNFNFKILYEKKYNLILTVNYNNKSYDLVLNLDYFFLRNKITLKLIVNKFYILNILKDFCVNILHSLKYENNEVKFETHKVNFLLFNWINPNNKLNNDMNFAFKKLSNLKINNKNYIIYLLNIDKLTIIQKFIRKFLCHQKLSSMKDKIIMTLYKSNDTCFGEFFWIKQFKNKYVYCFFNLQKYKLKNTNKFLFMKFIIKINDISKLYENIFIDFYEKKIIFNNFLLNFEEFKYYYDESFNENIEYNKKKDMVLDKTINNSLSLKLIDYNMKYKNYNNINLFTEYINNQEFNNKNEKLFFKNNIFTEFYYYLSQEENKNCIVFLSEYVKINKNKFMFIVYYDLEVKLVKIRLLCADTLIIKFEKIYYLKLLQYKDINYIYKILKKIKKNIKFIYNKKLNSPYILFRKSFITNYMIYYSNNKINLLRKLQIKFLKSIFLKQVDFVKFNKKFKIKFYDISNQSLFIIKIYYKNKIIQLLKLFLNKIYYLFDNKNLKINYVDIILFKFLKIDKYKGFFIKIDKNINEELYSLNKLKEIRINKLITPSNQHYKKLNTNIKILNNNKILNMNIFSNNSSNKSDFLKSLSNIISSRTINVSDDKNIATSFKDENLDIEDIFTFDYIINYNKKTYIYKTTFETKTLDSLVINYYKRIKKNILSIFKKFSYLKNNLKKKKKRLTILNKNIQPTRIKRRFNFNTNILINNKVL